MDFCLRENTSHSTGPFNDVLSDQDQRLEKEEALSEVGVDNTRHHTLFVLLPQLCILSVAAQEVLPLVRWHIH